MKSCVLVDEAPGTVSSASYAPTNWWPISVPTTVLNGLAKNGVYPDPRLGLNLFRIPDSSDEFNRKHDLDQFSYLPDKRNPWRDPYWFRTDFHLPASAPGTRVWLNLDSINYRAEVWLNSVKLAGPDTLAGMFQRFRLDITGSAKAGRNILAIRVFPVDHPGVPDAQLEPLGRDRGYHKEIMKDVTEVMTIGYDCMPHVPDRNMGLCQDVYVEWTGPVDIRAPFVVTDLPLPETNRARLDISVELHNASALPVKGALIGTVAGTDVHFTQKVELAPGQSRQVRIEPAPVLEKPRLWWPVNYGEQPLYDLDLRFETQGCLSDREKVAFGVRELAREMHEVNGWHALQLLVNGQKIFCRGGYIQPELLLEWDKSRIETEVGYFTRANLNLVYFEDIPNPPEAFLEACDRQGLMFGNCFYACYWLTPGSPYPEDVPLLERCTIDLLKRYRNHPSLVLYMAMNEGDTREDVYRFWRRHVIELDGTRLFIPSASFPESRKDAPDWFREDLPVGATDIGASYGWLEPVAYFQRVREARNWRFMMESGSASLPPVSSLARYIPELGRGLDGSPCPLDRTWAHHGANAYYKPYDQALRRLLGEPESVTDYCWKGHLLTADQHRSMFEAVNHRLWDITSGFTQWKINACWPSVQWQIFDWFLKPMVSFYYIKRACEPLHIQLNLIDRTVAVINNRLEPCKDLEVKARVHGLESNLRWEKKASASVAANSFHDCFQLPDAAQFGPLHFVRLELRDSRGNLVSDNFYWLPGQSDGGLQVLESLPPARLEASILSQSSDPGHVTRVKVVNPSDCIAFFVQLALTGGSDGAEILPVLWSDNYISLLPGESREITATFPAGTAGAKNTKLEVGGWNVMSAYECTSLRASSAEPRVGEAFTLTAGVAGTFLDGSRVCLRVDGKPAASRWAWARGAVFDEVAFKLKLDSPGKHELQVGSKRLVLIAR